MSAFIDLTGKIFLTLEVIELDSIKHTHAHWLVKCTVCSETKVISGSNLNSGSGKGCNSCSKWRLPYKTRVKIAHAYEDCIPNDEMMEEFNISRSSIYKVIKDFGIKANRNRKLK